MTDGKKTVHYAKVYAETDGVSVCVWEGTVDTSVSIEWRDWFGTHTITRIAVDELETRQGWSKIGVGIGPDTHEHTEPGQLEHTNQLEQASTPESTPARDASTDATST